MMVTGMLASDPTVASLGALTVNWPEALTRAVMPPDSLPPEYVYCFSSSYVPAGEWVSAVRSMIFASSPATASIVDDEKVGGGTSRPMTVIGRVSTAELMICVLSLPLPSTAVNVIEAGPP